jgi:hypothetical protein
MFDGTFRNSFSRGDKSTGFVQSAPWRGVAESSFIKRSASLFLSMSANSEVNHKGICNPVIEEED